LARSFERLERLETIMNETFMRVALEQATLGRRRRNV
jgi:hypothetical protein